MDRATIKRNALWGQGVTACVWVGLMVALGVTGVGLLCLRADAVSPQALPSAALSRDCINSALLIEDVTVPGGTVVDPGAAFTKVWRMQNMSTCDWASGYELRYVSGDRLSAAGSQPVNNTRVTGLVDISVPMVAPTQPGEYAATWKLFDPIGKPFGPPVSVAIRVEGVLPSGPPVQPAPTAAPARPPGHLAYVVAKQGVLIPSYDIYISKLDGSEQRLLWEWGRQPQFRQSDGRLLLNADGPEKGDLWTVDLDGSNPIQVSTHPEDAHPNWAPNPTDERILFDSQFYTWGREAAERIWTVWITYAPDLTYKPESVEVADRVVPGRCPVWLDNDWVVYNGCNFWEGGASCGLYTVPSWGDARARQITTEPGDLPGDSHGDWILYTGISTGNWDVYKVNFNGDEQVNLTNAPGNDGMPAFSPDGSRVAYVSDRDHHWAIWIMNADGSDPVKAFDLPGSLGGDWTAERISWGP